MARTLHVYPKASIEGSTWTLTMRRLAAVSVVLLLLVPVVSVAAPGWLAEVEVWVTDTDTRIADLEARVGDLEATTTINPTTTTTTLQVTTTTRLGIVVPAGTSIQAAVDVHPEGTVFLLSGVYNGQTVTPKNDQEFHGGVLDGGGGNLYAFQGSTTGVVIDGLTIRNYATAPQFCAIAGNSSSEWTIRNTEFVGNTCAMDAKTGWLVENNNIHHNQQIGMKARGADIVVRGNEIAYNNWLDEYEYGWEAGGTKFLFTTNLLVENNWVHDNHGPGLWTDADNIWTVYDGNLVTNNYGPGIFHEISYDAVIRNNTVTGNAHRFYVGGILVANSRNVEVYDNVLSGNDGGIIGLQADRGVRVHGPLVIDGLNVHHNTVAWSVGFHGVLMQDGNPPVGVFDFNTYQGTVFHWGVDELTWEQWQAEGHDLNGMSSG